MKLAIVGSSDEACGVASYTAALNQAFSGRFDVQVLNLKTAALIAHELLHSSEAAESHIDALCHELAKFDCVDLQLEWGLYGRDFDTIRRRLIKLIKACPRLILNLHSLHITEDSRAAQRAVIQTLKDRPNTQPYWFITHLPREAEFLRTLFGVENVTDFPVTYLTGQGVRDFYARTDPAAWKKRMGFKEDDIVILRAGFLAPHKDHMVSLKSLALLPPNYKLAFVGGEHPPGIRKFSVSPVVQEITNFLDQYDDAALKTRNHQDGAGATTLGDRVRFFGALSEEDMFRFMCCADFVTITHLESGQSSSGIASMALQLERPTILSYNRFFLEYEKYYKGGFSFFTMGNHYELRDKILSFDPECVRKLKEYGKTYSLDGLAALYERIYSDMTKGRINNSGKKMLSLESISSSLSSPPPAPPQGQGNAVQARQDEVQRIIYAVLWKGIGAAKKIRSWLRRARSFYRDKLSGQ